MTTGSLGVSGGTEGQDDLVGLGDLAIGQSLSVGSVDQSAGSFQVVAGDGLNSLVQRSVLGNVNTVGLAQNLLGLVGVSVNAAVGNVIVVHGVEDAEAGQGRGGALGSVVNAVNCQGHSVTELGVGQDGLVDAFGLTSLQAFLAGLQLSGLDVVIGSEVSAGRTLVLSSDGGIDADAVDLASQELQPSGGPLSDDLFHDSVGLVQAFVFLQLVAVPLGVTDNLPLLAGLEAFQLVSAPGHGGFLAGVVGGGPQSGAFNGSDLVLLVGFLVNQGQTGEVVSAVVGQVAFLIDQLDGVGHDDDQGVVIGSQQADIVPGSFGVGVVGDEEVQLFVGLGLPPADQGVPSSLHGGVSLDFGHGLALHLSSDVSGESGLSAQVVADQVSGAGSGIVGSGEAHGNTHGVLSGHLIGGRSQGEDDLGVQILGVDAVGAVCGEPAGLALLSVSLSANQVDGTGVEGVGTVVLEQGVQLLLHGVDEVTGNDGVAVFPHQTITQSNLESEATVAAQAPGFLVLSGHIFQSNSSLVLDGELAGNDFAELVELEVEAEEGGAQVAHQGGVVSILIGQLIPVGGRNGVVSMIGILLTVINPNVGGLSAVSGLGALGLSLVGGGALRLGGLNGLTTGNCQQHNQSQNQSENTSHVFHIFSPFFSKKKYAHILAQGFHSRKW